MGRSKGLETRSRGYKLFCDLVLLPQAEENTVGGDGERGRDQRRVPEGSKGFFVKKFLTLTFSLQNSVEILSKLGVCVAATLKVLSFDILCSVRKRFK